MNAETTRTHYIYRNMTAVFTSQFIQMLLGFVSRKIFIQMLGVSYLGYNSVFQNILSMLDLADLGIGVAITSFLYKPLAEKDWEAVRTLMVIYKRIYYVLGTAVSAIGMVMALFLPVFIPDSVHNLPYLQLLFFINLVGTVSTYYLAYKRTLLIADQKNYLAALTDAFVNIFFTVIQIVMLFVLPNYILFLVLTIAKNIVSNIIISYICTKRYRKNFGKPNNQLIKEYKKSIFRYVKDAFLSRLGSYVYYSTDNLVISSFKGSLLTGYLSNYTIITGMVQTVITQLFSSLQATFGNYVHTESDRKIQFRMASNYFFCNYLIANFCLCGVAFLIQPFIRLWLSEKMLLQNSTALLLGINLMLSILLIIPQQMFMIYQLYRYDKYNVAISAAINLALSIVLVQHMGINGVLIGTLVASLIYLFSRITILCRMVFHVPLFLHFLKVLVCFIVSGVSVAVSFFLSSAFTSHTIFSFVLQVVLVIFCSVAVPALFFCRTREFGYIINKLAVPYLYKIRSRLTRR